MTWRCAPAPPAPLLAADLAGRCTAPAPAGVAQVYRLFYPLPRLAGPCCPQLMFDEWDEHRSGGTAPVKLHLFVQARGAGRPAWSAASWHACLGPGLFPGPAATCAWCLFPLLCALCSGAAPQMWSWWSRWSARGRGTPEVGVGVGHAALETPPAPCSPCSTAGRAVDACLSAQRCLLPAGEAAAAEEAAAQSAARTQPRPSRTTPRALVSVPAGQPGCLRTELAGLAGRRSLLLPTLCWLSGPLPAGAAHVARGRGGPGGPVREDGNHSARQRAARALPGQRRVRRACGGRPGIGWDVQGRAAHGCGGPAACSLASRHINQSPPPFLRPAGTATSTWGAGTAARWRSSA